MNEPIDSLLKERDTTYGSSWRATGTLLGQIDIWKSTLMSMPEYLFNWIMILNKLVRILSDPNDVDHWRDIQGYARLVEMDIEDRWKQPVEVPHEESNAVPGTGSDASHRGLDEPSDSSAGR